MAEMDASHSSTGNDTQMKDALAWASDDYDKAKQPSTNPFVWLWEVIQGDFNEHHSTAQSLTSAGIGAIPLVGQVCTIRDLIADCRNLIKDPNKVWYWVVLALTLISLFPSLGALVKGVLKIFFAFLRRMGGEAVIKAVDLAMTWVISYLRRRNVQIYIAKVLRVDEIFTWLAKQVKEVKAMVNVKALTAAFDSGIQVLEGLANKVSFIPSVSKKAKAAIEQVKEIRKIADANLAKVLKPVQDILDRIILKFEHEALEKQRGILNANNVHFQGALPEDAAVKMMAKTEPPPEWLSKGVKEEWPKAEYAKNKLIVDQKVKEGWSKLSETNVESFHKLFAEEIKGPARLYRILAPNSRGMSDCWISEEIFNKIQNSPDPRAAWRKYLAVWPDWNVNGQFVIYDVKRGESLKVWRGQASSQVKANLKDRHLEGGWEQIVFNVERSSVSNDTMRYYKLKGGKGNQLRDAISQDEFNRLSKEEKATYTSMREEVNHPNISGPFETGWGYTDFGGEGFLEKVGVPNLPGQTTSLKSK